MDSSEKPRAVFLMGPTASGKSALAAELVDKYPFDLISVDSAQVYRGLDIGSAKPTLAELKKTPHRLIDIRDPSQAYSAADFRDDALAEMAKIVASNKIPLLVGGTMLYFKVLLEGLSDLPSADPLVRQRLLQESEVKGWPALHKDLAAIDAESANRIHPNDRQRVQRALEVFYTSGMTMTECRERQSLNGKGPWGSETIQKFDYNVTSFAIVSPDRSILHRRIAARFHLMLESGLVDEVRVLFDRGDLTQDLPAIKAVGYRQVWDCLAGKIDYDAMVEKGIIATRQLAKRQLTWLRSWPDVIWLDSDDGDLLDTALKSLPFATI